MIFVIPEKRTSASQDSFHLNVWTWVTLIMYGSWLQNGPRLWWGCVCTAAKSGFHLSRHDAVSVLETLILSLESCCTGLCHVWPHCLHKLKLNVLKKGREINIFPSWGTFDSHWGGAILKLRLRDGYFCPSARQTQLMVCIVQNALLTEFLKRRRKKSTGKVLKPPRGRHGSKLKWSYLYLNPSVVWGCRGVLHLAILKAAFDLIRRHRDWGQRGCFKGNSAESTHVAQVTQSSSVAQELVVTSLNCFRHAVQLEAFGEA